MRSHLKPLNTVCDNSSYSFSTNEINGDFSVGGEYALALIIILRMLVGLGAGPSFPALTVLLAAWVPQKETGALGTLIMGGGMVFDHYITVCHLAAQKIK